MTSVIHIRNAPARFQDDPQCVYIGRPRGDFGRINLRPVDPGYFGNPHVLTRSMSRGATLQAFEHYARVRVAGDSDYREAVKALHGKTLVCFCAPLPCHGDVLAKLAAELNA